MTTEDYDNLPDVRDGLTRRQRVVLYELHKARKELGREMVPTVMLYGRVVEHIDMTEAELYDVLASLGAGPRG
ncbi:MAG: hypothetical protein AAF458_18680 [Pseudomonadota bacterium]